MNAPKPDPQDQARLLLVDDEALAMLYRAVRAAPVHPDWTMRGERSRATIHALIKGQAPGRRALATLVRG